MALRETGAASADLKAGASGGAVDSGTPDQRKNSTLASRNHRKFAGAADIGPLIANTASSKLSPGDVSVASTVRHVETLDRAFFSHYGYCLRMLQLMHSLVKGAAANPKTPTYDRTMRSRRVTTL
jgi:hypothetical protein